MSGRRRDPLTPADRALWRAANRDTVPLPPDLRGAPDPSEPPGTPKPAPPPRAGGDPAPPPAPPRPPALPRAPSVTLDLAPPAAAPLGHTAPGLDRRTAERLRRGAREPQQRIDLHGMTAERAHRALERCIAQALAHGLRLVLVITGKGARPGSATADAPFMRPATGLLRREAPRWLRAGPHAAQIVGIFEAHPRHGGAGAFYVYLRRRR